MNEDNEKQEEKRGGKKGGVPTWLRVLSPITNLKRGGKIKKTGVKNLHADERVVPASKRKKVEKLMKRAGMSLTNKTHRKGGRKGKGSRGY